jgi:hypothetical protein
MRRLLVKANTVPISPILVTLMIEELRSSETSVLTEQHGVTSQKTAFYYSAVQCGRDVKPTLNK